MPLASDFRVRELAPNTGSALEAAQWYSAMGFQVVPIQPAISETVCTCRKGAECKSPGKHPMYIQGLVEHGFNSATRVSGVINEIWRKHPDAGVGIKGALFLDIDPRHGGEETIKRLQREHGRLPRTFTTRSGGGGWHKAFFAPDFAVPGELGPGVEIKMGKPGVIAAPTVHPSGKQYVLIDASQIAALPEGWLRLLRETSKVKPEPAPSSSLSSDSSDGGVDLPNIEVIPTGKRNNTLFHLGRAVRDEVKLLEVNRTRCPEPLPEAEVREIAQRALKYKPPKRKTDGELRDACGEKYRQWESEDWRYHGMLNLSVRDVERYAIERALRYGWIEPGYICFTASLSQMAKGSNVHKESISGRVLPRLRELGRAFTEPAQNPQHGSTWHIPIPETQSVNTHNGKSLSAQSAATTKHRNGVLTDCLGAPIKPLEELETPNVRSVGLVRKSRTRLLLPLDIRGSHTLAEMAERLGVSESVLRLRYLDDRRRWSRQLGAYVTDPGLLTLGLVELEGDVLRLPQNYSDALSEVLASPFDNTQEYKVRRKDHHSGRTVTDTRVRGCVASENERNKRDADRYAEQTRKWREHLAKQADVESCAFDQLQPVPDPNPESDAGEMTPDRAMLTSRGWECVGLSFGLVEWREPITGEVRREDIAVEIEKRRVAA